MACTPEPGDDARVRTGERRLHAQTVGAGNGTWSGARCFGGPQPIDSNELIADNELEPCPCCGDTSALPTPAGDFLVCLEWGLVRPDGRRVGDLKLAREDDRPAA